MKQWLLAAAILLCMPWAAAAQGLTLPALAASGGVSVNLAPESSASAAPMPTGETRSPSGDRGYHGFEMGLGYAFVKFRSAPINAAMSGLNSSVAYFLKSNLAIEANATTAFGHEIFDRAHTKFLFYGAGVKYVERRAKFDPWAHVLAGGVHMFPQTAAGSMNGLAVKVGGGVDYHWSRDSRISVRIEGAFVRSQLYLQGQNNFMFSTGFVIKY